LQARIVAGSIVLLSGSSLATAISLAYNIIVARFLGPLGFGHATAVYTILTLVSAVTLSFQIVSAKMVAQQNSEERKTAVYRELHLGAWGKIVATGRQRGRAWRESSRSNPRYLRIPGRKLSFVTLG